MLKSIIALSALILSFPFFSEASLSKCANLLGWEPQNTNPMPEMDATKALILRLLSESASERGMSGLDLINASKSKLNSGNVYPTLRTLEVDGLVKSLVDDSPEVMAQRGGRPRFNYISTLYGRRILGYWNDYLFGVALQGSKLKPAILAILIESDQRQSFSSIRQQIELPWHQKLFYKSAVEELATDGLLSVDQQSLSITDLGRRALRVYKNYRF